MNNRTPVDYARNENHNDLADRIVELQYEVTDRLAAYLCNRKPDHRSGQHYLIPEMADTSLDLSALAKKAKQRLQALPDYLFEELAMDVYDEVDRRENETAWKSTAPQTLSDRQCLYFLPVNPELSSTRNQGRQKLARFSAREFATLLIDLLTEQRRRHGGLTTSPPMSISISATSSVAQLNDTPNNAPALRPPSSTEQSVTSPGLSNTPNNFSTPQLQVSATDRLTGSSSDSQHSTSAVVDYKDYRETPMLRQSARTKLESDSEPAYDEVASEDEVAAVAASKALKRRQQQPSVTSTGSVDRRVVKRPDDGSPLAEPSFLTDQAEASPTSLGHVITQLTAAQKRITDLETTNNELKTEVEIMQNMLKDVMRENAELKEAVSRTTLLSPISIDGMSRGSRFSVDPPAPEILQPPLPVSTSAVGMETKDYAVSVDSGHLVPESPQIVDGYHVIRTSKEVPEPAEKVSEYYEETNFNRPQREETDAEATPKAPRRSMDGSDYENVSSPRTTAEVQPGDLSLPQPDADPVYSVPHAETRRILPATPPSSAPTADNLPNKDKLARAIEPVSKFIRELLMAAQHSEVERFAYISRQIASSSANLVGYFPESVRTPGIEAAVQELNSSIDRLCGDCTIPIETIISLPDHVQLIISRAYDVTKAAKHLVVTTHDVLSANG